MIRHIIVFNSDAPHEQVLAREEKGYWARSMESPTCVLGLLFVTSL